LMLTPTNFWPPRNFGAIDAQYAAFETARFVVLPVPYDATTTWRGGTREGPMAILDASMNMELFDVELGREIYTCGIHTTDDVEPRLSALPGLDIVQAGVRSSSAEEFEHVPANVTQFWAEDILRDFDGALEQIVAGLGPDVYLSFDVDVCDPSWMPDTGTPEP